MIYALYVAIGLGIFYAGFWIGREEMRYTLGQRFNDYYEQKLRAEKSSRHINHQPKTANHEIEYHDIHNCIYRARIFPN